MHEYVFFNKKNKSRLYSNCTTTTPNVRKHMLIASKVVAPNSQADTENKANHANFLKNKKKIFTRRVEILGPDPDLTALKFLVKCYIFI